MSKNKRYYQIIYIDEHNEPDYNCFYDTTIYDIDFTNSVLLVSITNTNATQTPDWMSKLISDTLNKQKFVLAIPLKRVVKINIVEMEK